MRARRPDLVFGFSMPRAKPLLSMLRGANGQGSLHQADRPGDCVLVAAVLVYRRVSQPSGERFRCLPFFDFNYLATPVQSDPGPASDTSILKNHPASRRGGGDTGISRCLLWRSRAVGLSYERELCTQAELLASVCEDIR